MLIKLYKFYYICIYFRTHFNKIQALFKSVSYTSSDNKTVTLEITWVGKPFLCCRVEKGVFELWKSQQSLFHRLYALNKSPITVYFPN